MDFRLAARALLRRPGFTLLAVGALALGIAGTTAVYSLVHNVLVRGLPFAEADRIVAPDVRSPQGYLISISIPNYRDWGARARVWERYGASAGWSFLRPAEDGATESLNVRVVLGDFFAALGLDPLHGRVFGSGEADRGAAPVAVLGHAFWRRAYGGDPSVIGRSLATDEFTATIVGVLPPGTGFPSQEVEAYVPMSVLGESVAWDDRGSSFGTEMVGLLRPGVTLEAAQADLSRVAREIAVEEGEAVAMPELVTLEDRFLGDVRAGLWVLMGAVALLLLIACANVANLALARAETRTDELAVRSALGAGRRRLVGLLLAESTVLAAAGGALGIALSAAAIRVLPRVLPLDLPTLVADRVALNGPIVAFALGVTALSGALFGLVPALRLGRGAAGAGSAASLSGARSTGSRDARRLRESLVVTQVALSLVLLVAAGLLTRSLGRLAAVEKGFVAEGVVKARLQAPEGTFPTPASRWAFYDALTADLEAGPDILDAAGSLLVPLVRRSWERGILPEGASPDPHEAPSTLFNVVTPGYFRTLGIPLLQGRTFDEGDREDATPVAIIDETMAGRFWPGEDPIGKRVAFASHDHAQDPEWLTVVGVVANTRHYELESPSRIQTYIPMRQANPLGLSVLVRTRPGAEPVGATAIRDAVTRLAPGTAVTELRPLDDVVGDRLGPARALGTLTGVFAGSAALLSALGLFGVLTLAVTRRRRELGVRMAVGATTTGILALIGRYALRLVAAGTLLGLAAAAAATRVLGSLLFEVRPFDPAVYGLVVVGLVAVVALAALAPAIRAARVEPARVLREG